MRTATRTMIAAALVLAAAFVVAGPLMAQTIKRTKAMPIRSIDGRETFVVYCATCHGLEGKGDGRAAALLKAPPPDLTRLAARSRGKFQHAAVEFTIKGDPERPRNVHRDMPAWQDVFRSFSADDNITRLRIQNVVEYLHSIQAK